MAVLRGFRVEGLESESEVPTLTILFGISEFGVVEVSGSRDQEGSSPKSRPSFSNRIRGSQ